MKRVLIKNTLGLILFVFLLSGVFAVAPETCGVVERENCNGYVVMGLSDLANAHGELASGSYDF